MKASRLSMLVAVALCLFALRFALPPANRQIETVPPVAFKAGDRSSTLATRTHEKSELSAISALAEDDIPGNAFPVRVVPPPPVPPPMVPVTVVAVVAPAVPSTPEPLPPPLQVIGTFNDGGAPAVFIATPTGTLMARTGSVLLAEYRVTNISARQVSLTENSTQRTLQLQIPAGAP